MALVMSLSICCSLLLQLWGSVFVPCFVVHNCVSFLVLLEAEERAGCFTFFVFLVSCDCCCSSALPHGAVDWSVVCYCVVVFLIILTCFFKPKCTFMPLADRV